MTIEQALRQAKQQLQQAGLLDSPQLDAEILLCHLLEVNRSYLFTWPEKQLSEEQASQFQQLLNRRLKHEPIAFITGYKEFWGLDLQVAESTLIPRADTETLIEAALGLAEKPNWKILDLGTGTGAIALALKTEWPDCQITGIDFNHDAVQLAKFNAQTNQLKVTFLQSDWFSNLDQQSFDLIVSNPPYIEENDPHIFAGDVQFEPRSALTSGSDGLEDIRLIIDQAKNHLNKDGWLILEHGYNQATAIEALFTQANYHNYQLHHDLAGNPRISMAQIKSNQDV